MFTVGLGVVLQQTPREVTGVPPLPETKPPVLADVEVISSILAVVTKGVTALELPTPESSSRQRTDVA